MVKRLTRGSLLALALLLGALAAAVPQVSACSPTATPYGFVAYPTPFVSEQVDRAMQDADVIFEGEVLDIWTESFRQVIVVEVKQYLKGVGGDIVRMVGYVNPCPYGPVYVGTRGLFFTRSGGTARSPLRHLARFVPDDSIREQVTSTVGTEPFTPPRSPSLAALTLLSLTGILAVSSIAGWHRLRRNRLMRLQNRDKTIAYYESTDMISPSES